MQDYIFIGSLEYFGKLYITFNQGICDICETGVDGFFMEYKINNQSGTYQKAIDADDVYLRLESKENLLSGFYATDAGE